MPHISETFTTSKEVSAALAESDEIFRYCKFESAAIDGGSSDGVFLGAHFWI